VFRSSPLPYGSGPDSVYDLNAGNFVPISLGNSQLLQCLRLSSAGNNLLEFSFIAPSERPKHCQYCVERLICPLIRPFFSPEIRMGELNLVGCGLWCG